MITYTVAPIWKSVSKSEFEEYLQKYPRPLVRNVYMAVEPPSVSYNDFQLADLFPFCAVASTSIYETNPDSFYFVPEQERVYKVVTNFEECFTNRINIPADPEKEDT